MPHHPAWLPRHSHTCQLCLKSWCILLVFLGAPSAPTETHMCFLHPHTGLFFDTYPHTQAQSTQPAPFLLCYSLFFLGSWLAAQLPAHLCMAPPVWSPPGEWLWSDKCDSAMSVHQAGPKSWQGQAEWPGGFAAPSVGTRAPGHSCVTSHCGQNFLSQWGRQNCCSFVKALEVAVYSFQMVALCLAVILGLQTSKEQ